MTGSVVLTSLTKWSIALDIAKSRVCPSACVFSLTCCTRSKESSKSCQSWSCFRSSFFSILSKVIEGDSISFPIAWITDFKLSQLSQLAWCSWEQLPWNSGFWGSLKEKHIQWSGQGLPSSWQYIPYSVFRYRLASFSALRTSSHHFSVKRWFSKGVGIFLATAFKILFNHPRSSNDSDDIWHDEMIPRVRKLSSFTKSIRTLWWGILLRLKPAPTFSRQKLWKLHFRSLSTQGV